MKRDDWPLEQMHRYADGDLSEEEVRTLEAWLEKTPEAADLVRLWQQQNEAIRASLPYPDPRYLTDLADRAATHGSPRHVWSRVAAAVVLIGIGFGAGTLTSAFRSQSNEEQALLAGALAAHALFSVEVKHPVEVAAKERDHLNMWLSNRIGAPITAPQLEAAGFELVGGRLLPLGNRPAAQFMYQDSAGARITLFAVRSDRGDAFAFRHVIDDGMSVVYWSAGGWKFAMVGGAGQQKLEELAGLANGELT